MSKLQGILINFFAKLNPILVPTYIHDLFFSKKKHVLRCCTSIVVANCLGYVYAAWAWSIYSTKVQSGKCNVSSFGVQRALPPIYLVQVYTLEWRYGSVLFGSTVAYSPREVSASPAAPGRDVPPPLLGTHESDVDARAAHASPWNPVAQGLTGVDAWSGRQSAMQRC